MNAGLIIAGGRSTRFGRIDKAVATLAGVPMIRRVADAIEPIVDLIVVNCREDQRDAIEQVLAGLSIPVEYRLDDRPDQGPLHGIATGIRDLEATYVFVVACDMPFVQSSVVELLLERATEREAAVPRIDGWFEPLHAVYRASAMHEACSAAIQAGEERIVSVFEYLDYVAVSEAEIERVGSLESFDNVNTTAELAEASARITTHSNDP